MRNDLPSMSTGRAMAQASHASNAFWKECGTYGMSIAWANQTPQGFGTAIVLSVNYTELKEICSKSISEGFSCNSVIDQDYVITVPSEVIPCIDDKKLIKFEQSLIDPAKWFYHRSEVTCAYIFGDKEEINIKIPEISQLPLHP